MESAEYRIMHDLETSYWWFRNLHDMLIDLLAPHVRAGDSLLDAGCGTGGLLRRLEQLSPQVYGFDLSAEAAPFWKDGTWGRNTARASINTLPYPADCFRAVVSVDILECEGVEDARAYAELVRVTQPGGWVVIVVPAYQWMMTEGHHKAVHAVRRYNRHSVRALAAGCPITIQRVTHAFAAVFPMVAAARLRHRWQERRGEVEIKSELSPLPPLLNGALYHLTTLERHALRYLPMPFGSSLIMVGRKDG